MTYFLQILISGLVIGCIYGMAALGFTIVFNATRVINFANGEFLMLGGLATAAVIGAEASGWGTVAAVLVAAALTTLVGLLMQALAFDKAKSRDLQMLVMLTIGITLMLRGGASIVFGRSVSFVNDFGGFPELDAGGVFIPPQGLWIIPMIATRVTFHGRLGAASAGGASVAMREFYGRPQAVARRRGDQGTTGLDLQNRLRGSEFRIRTLPVAFPTCFKSGHGEGGAKRFF